MPKVGRRAPDFDLPTTLGAGRERGRARLSDFDGRWLVLTFYPRDFSLVCPTELTALNSRLADFEDHHCSLLGISTDTLETHDRWIATPRAQGGLGALEFPLASDAGGLAASAYGVYQERQKICLRGLFIIDPNGVLQYQAVNTMSVGRRADDVLRVLAALDSGGMCPEDWGPNTAPLDPVAALRPGNMFSSYRIESAVGGGSFGSVFRARDTTLDRTVALKVFKPSSSGRWDSVLHEARSAATLQHPNVCAVYAVDASEGSPAIAMEYVAGPTLRAIMDEGAIPLEKLTDLAHQMACGLEAAHAEGVSHGDLKPANVMVTERGVVKIADFGLARRAPKSPAAAAANDATQLTSVDAGLDGAATAILASGGSIVAGTPAYMAPEMTRGIPANSASDTFAFGLILREMLTGKRLFSGDDPGQILRQIAAVDPAAAAAHLPGDFAGLVEATLAVEPDHRPAMVEVRAQLAGRISAA
jgi:alkyl hydroperoxide reductase subunit AhpC